MPTTRARLSIADACTVIGDAGFGAHPPGVGLELEWFVVDADGRRVSDPDRVRTALDVGGPLPHHSRITFEPGGQLEISTPPSPDGPTALAVAEADGLAARTRIGADGLAVVGVGADAGGLRPRVIDEPRYRAMATYFDALGAAGATMMRGTASLQVNVGYAQDVDAQWEYVHDLAPVVAAMFANSPLLDGRPSGWQTTRLATWAALDPPRTRPVATGRGARNTWIQYALDAPVMLIRNGDDCTVPSEPLTLRAWIHDGHELGHPTADDIAYHLTTLFPPIRPRGWLELRMLDALPEPWWHIAAAVTVTAIADAPTRIRLAPVVAGARELWLDAAWHGVHHEGLGARAEAVVDAVIPSLARSGYDATLIGRTEEFAADYVHRRRSLADDLLDAWQAHGVLAPPPEPVPVVAVAG
jgi:glutamate--cysteine ligase